MQCHCVSKKKTDTSLGIFFKVAFMCNKQKKKISSDLYAADMIITFLQLLHENRVGTLCLNVHYGLFSLCTAAPWRKVVAQQWHKNCAPPPGAHGAAVQ